MRHVTVGLALQLELQGFKGFNGFQIVGRARIDRETLKMLNNGGHRILLKIVTHDETYTTF